VEHNEKTKETEEKEEEETRMQGSLRRAFVLILNRTSSDKCN